MVLSGSFERQENLFEVFMLESSLVLKDKDSLDVLVSMDKTSSSLSSTVVKSNKDDDLFLAALALFLVDSDSLGVEAVGVVTVLATIWAVDADPAVLVVVGLFTLESEELLVGETGLVVVDGDLFVLEFVGLIVEALDLVFGVPVPDVVGAVVVVPEVLAIAPA